MRYIALATDYDGTLAHDGVVSPETVEALERLRHSGRRLILVTGRELPDLGTVFSRFDLFDRIVAENGALVYDPATRETRPLVEAPPARFVQRLRERGVPEVAVGQVIVAMWRPHEQEALDTIRELGLDLQVIFNKDAVMILPSGVNKMTGLIAALRELRISPRSVVAVGDAENDHAFLSYCECAVAVANAIPSLKEEADLVTQSSDGGGVAELIGALLRNDLADLAPRMIRHNIPLGKSASGDIGLGPFGSAVLVCGQSGSGKSTLIAGLVERLAARGYQVCLIDPEGDYERAEEFVTTGDPSHPPSLDHLEKILHDPGAQIAVNFVGVSIEDRTALFGRVLALVQEHRLRNGRPHWLIVDEAHHMFPSEWAVAEVDMAGDVGSVVLVTVHPEHVSPAVLRHVNVLIAAGKQPGAVVDEFCRVIGRPTPAVPPMDLSEGEALVWFVGSDKPERVKTDPPRTATSANTLRENGKKSESSVSVGRRGR